MPQPPDVPRLLARTTPFIVSHRANWPHLNLAPLGVEIPATHRFDPTRLDSRDVIDGLHRLDRFSFGPQDMLMPRWVLFDCGEFPGLVMGLGAPARTLPLAVRRAYHVDHRPDAFVPLSMWVAVHNAEPGAWFGHNLSSANLVLGDAALPGLATVTKALGIAATGATRQYGATQWGSPSLHIHLNFGDLHLLSAYTPAHTHPATFAYRLEVDPARLAQVLTPGWRKPQTPPTLTIDADDGEALLDLHAQLEAGVDWLLVGADPGPEGRPQRIHLRSA